MEINDNQLESFNRSLESMTGIYLAKDKKYLIKNRLGDLIRKEYYGDFNRFLLELKKPEAFHTIKPKLVELMTTRETFWFREQKHFDVLKERVLPGFADEIRQGKRRSFRFWSAASSSGQEPYSVAMLIAKHFPSLIGPTGKPIQATDISLDALEKATQGLYGSFEISRGFPAEYESYIRDGQITDKIRNMVEFKQFNLMNSFAGMGQFDVIFLRNVLIYFTEDTKKEIIKKAHKQLTKGGCLFLSTTERIAGLEELFERDMAGSFYWKKEQDPFSLNF